MEKVLAITSDTNKIRYGCVGGNSAKPFAHDLKTMTISYPPDMHEGAGLCAMLKTLDSLLNAEKPTRVVMLRSSKGQFNNQLAIRPVVEALVQISCEWAHIPCSLISPATLRSKEKKFEGTANKSPEVAFCSGNSFRPKEAREVYLTGWLGLPE